MAGRPRVVIASPYLAESEMMADWLSSDGCDPIRTSNCADAMTVVQAVRFDLLIVDSTFAFRDGLDAATRKQRRNPQTPTVVMGESKAEQVQADQKGAMYLGRPVDRATLQCTVSMALMEERPVRRSPRKPVNRIPAVVDGVPSHILDVSPEGLRIEIPRDRLSSLAPYFSVRVPTIGVSLLGTADVGNHPSGLGARRRHVVRRRAVPQRVQGRGRLEPLRGYHPRRAHGPPVKPNSLTRRLSRPDRATLRAFSIPFKLNASG